MTIITSTIPPDVIGLSFIHCELKIDVINTGISVGAKIIIPETTDTTNPIKRVYEFIILVDAEVVDVVDVEDII